jgi:tagaturonate reductase
VSLEQDQYYGETNGMSYPIQDNLAEVFYKRWLEFDPAGVVEEVLRDNAFWGEDLYILPGFAEAVLENLNIILASGVKKAIEKTKNKKTVAA